MRHILLKDYPGQGASLGSFGFPLFSPTSSVLDPPATVLPNFRHLIELHSKAQLLSVLPRDLQADHRSQLRGYRDLSLRRGCPHHLRVSHQVSCVVQLLGNRQ